MKNQKTKSNKKIIIIISIALAVILVGIGIYVMIDKGLFSNNEEPQKPIEQYTFSDYENMTEEEKAEFKARFENEEKFDEWLSGIQEKSKSDIPWENGGKTPDQYTLKEFEALDSMGKIAFSQWFKSEDEFYAWQEKAEEANKDPIPWEEEGAKTPDQYTYDEFSNLTGEQQIKFQFWFDSPDDFDKWLSEAQSK